MTWFRKLLRQKDYEPSHYLISRDTPAQRFSSGNIAKGIGALVTVLTIIASICGLYERSKKPSLNLNLEETISGYFIRVVNSGNTTAISVKVDLESWPVGAPGSWRWSFPVRDLPPQSDSTIPIELVPSSLPDSDKSEMLDALMNSVLSGYVMVSCNNCSSSKNWAFSIPGHRSKGGALYARHLPALVGVSKLADRPRIGFCVDVPKGVCGDFPSVWANSGSH